MDPNHDLYPCVRCLNKAMRKIVRTTEVYFTIQCVKCGFNVVSTDSMDEAINIWNNFEVWKLVPEEDLDLVCQIN